MAKAEEFGYLTADEVERRIGALTPADCVRLETIARVYAWGTNWTAADLLQEGMLAALERRQWRVDLDVTVFLTGVMRSLASSKRKSERVAPLDRALAAGGEASSELSEAPDNTTPEELLAEDQAADLLMKQLQHAFADDAQALRVIEGRAAGKSPAHIRASLGLSQREYETVCRRLLRGYQGGIKVRQS